jgi:hypothetical protein
MPDMTMNIRILDLAECDRCGSGDLVSPTHLAFGSAPRARPSSGPGYHHRGPDDCASGRGSSEHSTPSPPAGPCRRDDGRPTPPMR